MNTALWEKPEIRDYGTLHELTEAVGQCNNEDSLNKFDEFHHTTPC